jgi:hypothetical protein
MFMLLKKLSSLCITYNVLLHILSFSYFCSTVDGTQDLAHARQVFYHCTHASSLVSLYLTTYLLFQCQDAE